MLLIVAHHFVVNSEVTNQFDLNHISSNTLFLQIFGMWGKTGINVFILISGYFLCEMTLTWQHWLKIYLQWKGYRIVIFILLLILGYETLSVKNIFNIVFEIARNINHGFIASFLLFYLFVPFYNLLLKTLSKKNHELLIGLLLLFFTVFGTFTNAKSVFVESVWYIVLYFIAAYIRAYKPRWMCNFKITFVGLISSVLLAVLSVGVFDYVGAKLDGRNIAFYMVSDSNKILALAVGMFAFLTFKDMKPRENKFINTIASTVFGVLCIHASSDAMRTFLWKDVVNVPQAYFLSFGLFSIGMVCVIFAVCAVIDFLRIILIEKPLFKGINKSTQNWKINDHNIIQRVLTIYNHIGTN